MLNLRSIAALSVITLSLTACGDGSDSSNLGVLQTSLISGTAATANGPITNAMNATVTLKDSSGPAKTASTTVDSQGHFAFTLDQVEGFATPWMIEVSYQIGGTTYYLHSAVTFADYANSNATVNVTPLTDVIVGNIVGNDPHSVFANGGFAAALTSTALTSGVQSLNTLLQPLFSGIGITSTNPDLLHQAFTVNHTGLDALLDAVHVNIDPLSKTEVITNALNGSSISGTLNAPPTTPLSTVGSASLSDQQSIASFLNSLTVVFADQPTSTSSSLLAFFDQSNFVQDGVSLSTYLQKTISNTQVTGGSLAFTDIVLASTPSFATLPTGASSPYNVSFTAIQNNKPTGRYSYIIYKTSAGTWRILGNQQKAKIDLKAFEGDNNNTLCSGLQLHITDNGAFKDSSNNPLSISYATVTGLGIDSNLLFFNNGSSTTLTLANGDVSSYAGTNTKPATNCYSNVYAMDDAHIGQINLSSLPANYTVTLYNVTGAQTTTLATYPVQLFAPPLTSTDLTTTIFPSALNVSPALPASAASGTPLTVSWTVPSANTTLITSNNLLPSTLCVSVSGTAGGGQSLTNIPLGQTQATITPPTTTSPNAGKITVSYIDSFFRNIWTSPASGF
ncbi:hypothetical protein [Aquirhabdus sp.]|uniref:hypothetical protein n=1 Tax=Aquirhabdus sp. TaxID=2824160 RepID=UPI00396C9968